MFESGRHHADDLHGFSIKLNLASYNVWVASKTAGPKTIGQHDNIVGARLEFFRSKNPTVCGRHSQHWEEVGRRGEAKQTFGRLALFGEIAADVVVSGNLTEQGQTAERLLS